MRLTSVLIENYKSIHDSGVVKIEPTVTVLVGQNESGKTAFLQALHKARPVNPTAAGEYDRTEEYPRRYLSKYGERHDGEEAVVATLGYELSDDDVAAVAAKFGPDVLTGRTFQVAHQYGGGSTSYVTNIVNEAAYIARLVSDRALDSDAKLGVAGCTSMTALVAALADRSPTTDGLAFKQSVETRGTASTWPSTN
jgi:hypothetical protein